VENGGPVSRIEAAMKYTAVVAGKSIGIEFEAKNGTVEARIGNRQYKLESSNVEPGVYWFNLENQSIEVRVTPAGDSFTVSIGGHSLPVEIVDARNALKKAAHRGHEGMVEVRAPMPGKVVRVLVAEGAEVNANQGLLVMEAMKMQNEIKSPKKGVVRRLGVKEGVAVNSGDLLASIE
jgi:biotin carboxyl carrier protein